MTQTTNTGYDYKKYKTPTGTTLNCKGWVQEAALRMLLNNLDPEVAERPEDLIVYGGRGKAARNFEALDNIIASLKSLESDESLLIQSGKPVGILKTHKDAPRVLISNSQLVPKLEAKSEQEAIDFVVKQEQLPMPPKVEPEKPTS